MLSNFKFIFTPRKLLSVEEDIKTRHQNINERDLKLAIDDEYLRKLVNKINSLNKEELLSFSYRLKREDLFLLAVYMPKNQYNIDLEKVYIILKNRFREQFIKILFEGFKNHYYNKEFNRHLIQFLNLSENSHGILNIGKNELEIIKKWLRQDDLVATIVQSCLKIKKDFNPFMLAFKFNEDTQIYRDCRKHLYTICNKEYYLFGDINEILGIFETYILDEKIAFMNNYLTILEIEEFQDPVLNHIYYTYGDPKDGLMDNIWRNISNLAVEKYKIWLAQKHMKEFFGGDERYIFWYDYIKNLEAELLHVNERQLFIDFGEFVVIEFRNIGNAAYIYRKSDFDRYFRKYINMNTVYSDTNLKYRHIVLERVIHNKGWQYRTHNLIRGVKNYVQNYRSNRY